MIQEDLNWKWVKEVNPLKQGLKPSGVFIPTIKKFSKLKK